MCKFFAVIAAIFAIGLMTCASGGEKALQHGSVKTHDFASIILHAYRTGDAMADECFVLETGDRLIAIEAPAFDRNIQEWKEYLDALHKPLTDILISYHPTGGAWYGDAVSHATESAGKAIATGGTGALVGVLKAAFGDGFNDDISAIDKTLRPGANTIGGVEFVITDNGDGYDIAIPAIKAVYMHMLGARVHSILTGQDHIAACIGTLQGYKNDGYTLFLSGHHTPETVADVDEKIAYLRGTAGIAAASANRADFIERMRAACPSHTGENYLEMTAGAFFAE